MPYKLPNRHTEVLCLGSQNSGAYERWKLALPMTATCSVSSINMGILALFSMGILAMTRILRITVDGDTANWTPGDDVRILPTIGSRWGYYGLDSWHWVYWTLATVAMRILALSLLPSWTHTLTAASPQSRSQNSSLCPRMYKHAIVTYVYRSTLQIIVQSVWRHISESVCSMTLNDLERRNSPYFAFFYGIWQIFRPILSQWLKIDNVRKILSPSSSLLLLAKTITHPAARSRCDSWASC